MRTPQFIAYAVMWFATIVMYTVAMTAYKDDVEKRRLSASLCLCFMLTAQAFAPHMLERDVPCWAGNLGMVVVPIVGYFMLYANHRLANGLSIWVSLVLSLFLLGMFRAVSTTVAPLAVLSAQTSAPASFGFTN